MLENGAKENLNGRASCVPTCPLSFETVWLFLLFLGCFIDKQQAGSVEGIKGLYKAESWFDKYALPSGNPGSDTSEALGD